MCALAHTVTAPATHLSHRMHTTTGARGCGSSSGMNCDVAKGHGLANGPQGFVCLCRGRWVVRTDNRHSFVCMNGPADDGYGRRATEGGHVSADAGYVTANTNRLQGI
jgi:hypothetical protein